MIVLLRPVVRPVFLQLNSGGSQQGAHSQLFGKVRLLQAPLPMKQTIPGVFFTIFRL